MPHIKDHMQACIDKFGKPYKEVNIWLDEMARHVGIWTHRGYRHHREGIEYIRQQWGDGAAAAAELHVLMDCGGIPTKQDYESGAVNNFGVKQY